MKLTRILIFCLILTIGVTGAVYSQDSDTLVEDLEWMAGCWQQNGKNADSFISEQWTRPFGMMIGTNRTVRDGKVRAFEYMRIESRDNGVYFVARPSGAANETGFRLLSLKKKKVVFAFCQMPEQPAPDGDRS